MRQHLRRAWGLTLLVPLLASAQNAPSPCERVLRLLGHRLTDATCIDSADLTTNGATTTPANNALPGLPPLAFTPTTDATVIAPSVGKRTPIGKAVPGLQIQARLAGDPTGQGRFLLRLPHDWSGRLVVAGASGTRSEFNGDLSWSDYVLQKGHAYASQNKGVLNLRLSTAADPLGCRLNPASTTYVHFYDNDPDQPFTRWTDAIVTTADIARDAVRIHYGRPARYTYAVGTSNGGYQVRRAIETAPRLFDGGVDWEGTYVDEHGPNLLTDLPPAVLNWPDYVASGFNPNSTAAKNIRAAGYPPDIVSGANSFWGLHWAQFWEVTLCQWQKRFDPTYDTYGAGLGGYNYHARRSVAEVDAPLAAVANTGQLRRPLITVAGTMDALLPIDHHARAYQRQVEEASASPRPGRGAERFDRDDDWGDRRPAYRLYEVQNGNHIETYQDIFPQLALIEPHAHRAFDLLVQHVEHRLPLPPDQCIPKGGAIASVPAPGQAGHCAALFVP